MLINNFDLKVSAVKLQTPLTFGARIQAVRLPNPDDEVTLGYLASMLAWTPTGVNFYIKYLYSRLKLGKIRH